MDKVNFPYIRKIANGSISSVEDVLQDQRLLRNLWLDLILEPALVKECKKFIDRPSVKEELTKALSWCSAFKWLFGRHLFLEELAEKGVIPLRSLSAQDFRKDYRSFLKGIIPLLG